MSETPLVLLGVDGADHRLVLRWAAEGHLPTLASLMGRGCWATIGGPEQVCEHGSSLSLLSGVSRSRHGYYFMRQLVPGTYDLRTFSYADADALPFWSRLAGTGKRVAVIDAPDSRPVKGVEGIQLANWAVHEPATAPNAPCAEPPELLEEALAVFGPRIPVLEFKPGATFEDDLEMYRRFLRRVRRKGEMCRRLLGRGEGFDLIAVGFFESHTAAHRFWKYRPEARGDLARTDGGELTHAIREVYRAIDRELGLLLEQLPSGANVFVFSAFGMEDYYTTTGLMESFCRRLGYQASPPPAGFSPKPLALARRLLPAAWREWVGGRLPTPAQERLLAESFRASTDWPRTRAFNIPTLYPGFVRVNLRGREPQGRVEPGEEYDSLLGSLEDDLMRLTDPLTGRGAVRDVVRSDVNFGGGPPTLLPDLFVEWEPHVRFMERVTHPRAELAQRRQRYHRDSYHSRTGFLAAAGPSVGARGHTGELSSLDVAPMFLSLLGVQAADAAANGAARALGCRGGGS